MMYRDHDNEAMRRLAAQRQAGQGQARARVLRRDEEQGEINGRILFVGLVAISAFALLSMLA